MKNTARDHDFTKVDGEVSHAVCGKSEHPGYNKRSRYDLDIAVLHLCKPIMFSQGNSYFFTFQTDSHVYRGQTNLPARPDTGAVLRIWLQIIRQKFLDLCEYHHDLWNITSNIIQRYLQNSSQHCSAQNYDSLKARVSGWGKTSSGVQSNILQDVEVRTMSNRECRKTKYRNYQITRGRHE